jgi:hypothetical protein
VSNQKLDQQELEDRDMNKRLNHWQLVTALLAAMPFSGAAGNVQALELVDDDDTCGVPFDQFLDVEEFGVLDNDSLDG